MVIQAKGYGKRRALEIHLSVMRVLRDLSQFGKQGASIL